MRTCLTLSLFAVGSLLMLSSLAMGLGCWAVASMVFATASVQDEEAFITALMLMGGLGAVAPVVVDIYMRFTALP